MEASYQKVAVKYKQEFEDAADVYQPDESQNAGGFKM